jgi:RND family efflux transporter MFP subunit
MSKVKWLLPVIVVTLGLLSCGENTIEKKTIIRKVKVTKVKEAPSTISKEYYGTLEEAGNVNLAFRVAGPIQKIHVNEGQYVSKGQLIAEIDERDYQIQLDGAQAQYENALAEIKRVKALYKKKSIAPVDYDKAVSAEKMLKVQLRHAKVQLEDTKLYAPFSGYIQEINFEDGELVNTGTPIGSLINVQQYKLDIDVPASIYINRNQFNSHTAFQSLSPDRVFYPLLHSSNKKANNNQLYQLHYFLESDTSNALAPGMDMRVVIEMEDQNLNPLYIPLESLYNEGGDVYVWIYEESSQTVKKRRIHTDGLYKDKGIRIIEGLAADEIVVSAGISSLKENQKVELLPKASKTNVGGLL